MKNTFLLFSTVFALNFLSCKKSVDLDPPKRLKTIESDASLTTYFYDSQRRLSKTITKNGTNTNTTTYDYSVANQITQLDEFDNTTNTKTQITNLMSLNKDGLVTVNEVTQRSIVSGQNPTITSRQTVEYSYNAEKNLVSTTNTNRNITTGELGSVFTVENVFSKKNLVTQTFRSKFNAVNDISNTTTNNQFKSDKNTLGLSYRGQNYFGVSSLNLAVSATQFTRTFDQNNLSILSSTSESTTSNENFLDSDGYLIKRITTVKSSFSSPTGTKTTNPDRVTTTIYTYE